jgi:hypothetical protein
VFQFSGQHIRFLPPAKSKRNAGALRPRVWRGVQQRGVFPAIARGIIAVLLGASLSQAEIVDRIVAVVGSHPITWSEVYEEANYQALIAAREPPSWLPSDQQFSEEFRQILSQIADRVLLETALANSPYSPGAAEDGAEATLRELRQRYPSAAAFQEALARYSLSEQELEERLERQRTLMAFTSLMLASQVRLTEAELRGYYENVFSAELRRQGVASIPPLADVRDRIEAILTEQEVNRLLEDKLAELRRSTPVRIWSE